MPKSNVAPAKRTRKPKKKTSFGDQLIQAMGEIIRFAEGEDNGVKVSVVKIPPLILCVRELKAAREKAGMTLAQVAEKAGIRLETVSRLELGKVKNPTIDTLQRYANAVGVELRLSVVPVKKAKSPS